MDFLEDEAPKPLQKPRRSLAWFWNFLTLLVLLGMVAVVWAVMQIYAHPESALNPFPQPTMVPTLFIPTNQPLAILEPTSTVTATPLLATLPPTATYTATPTAMAATPGGPLDVPTATATPRVSSIFSFVLQAEPRVVDSIIFNSGRGCEWMGVAGQAFDLKNSPVALGIIVQVAGVVDGKVLNITSLTGTATQYGPAGYEITLADKPAASHGAVWVRLLDQAGFAISDRVFFDTSADCTKNLVIVNFKQIK